MSKENFTFIRPFGPSIAKLKLPNEIILELNKLNNMNAEVLEFLVNKDSKVKGKKIRDLDFPRSAIIGGVIRDGVGKIALGDFVIKKGLKLRPFFY